MGVGTGGVDIVIEAQVRKVKTIWLGDFGIGGVSTRHRGCGAHSCLRPGGGISSVARASQNLGMRAPYTWSVGGVHLRCTTARWRQIRQQMPVGRTYECSADDGRAAPSLPAADSTSNLFAIGGLHHCGQYRGTGTYFRWR